MKRNNRGTANNRGTVELQSLDDPNYVSLHSHYSMLPSRGTEIENQWIIQERELKIEVRIAVGAYGEVFKGKWRDTPVASMFFY